MNTISKPESEPSPLDEAELSAIQGGGFGDFNLVRARALLKQFAPLLKRILAARPPLTVTPVPNASVV